jgi:hypothetical protein
MNAAVVPPPDYAGLVGCAALGGLITQSSPRYYAQRRVGCRGFYAPCVCGMLFTWEQEAWRIKRAA